MWTRGGLHYMFKLQKTLSLVNPYFAPVVVFLDRLLHQDHRAFSKNTMAGWLRTGQGRSGSKYWTWIRSFSSFLSMHQRKHKRADAYCAVRNADPDLDDGFVVRCCTGFAPFYGTGARADVRIRTFGPGSAYHRLNREPYRFTQKVVRICLILSKDRGKNISKAVLMRRESGSGSSDPDP